MTPAARVQAAIDLIREIEQGGEPADRTVAEFFRRRRYAGSKDRAEVTALVYAVLRARGRLAWRAGEQAEARRLVIAHLAQSLPADEVRALFSGARFGPAPLTPEEEPLLAPPQGVPPDWAIANVPSWLEPELRERFGGDFLDEAAALNERAPLDMRVNLLRASREPVLRRFAEEGIDAEPTRFSPVGVRLRSRERLERHPFFDAGLVEVQDEGSQLAALLVDAQPGHQVLDLCAGAGGKSLALAAQMLNRGQIYATDVARRRLDAARPRLERAGVRNVQLHAIRSETDPWLDQFAGRLDRVLIDAPCSGSGRWRRDPEARWRLTPMDLERAVDLQDRLLQAGARLVRPSGRLIYAVCSLLPTEGERRIEAFRASRPDFALLPPAEVWSEAIGGACPDGGAPWLTLTPQRHGCDGFFVAILQKG